MKKFFGTTIRWLKSKKNIEIDRKSNPTSLSQKFFLVIFGIIFAILSLEAFLRVGGFLFLTAQEWRNLAVFSGQKRYRIMCIGESTTALGGKDAYPCQLGKILNAHAGFDKFHVINKGIPGTHIAAIFNSLENELNRYKPQMVVAMIGINDSREIKAQVPVVDSRGFWRNLRVYKLSMLVKKSLFHPRYVRQCVLGNNTKSYAKRLSAADAEKYKISAGMGFYYHQRGEFKTAIGFLEKAACYNNKDAVIYNDLGDCYLNVDEFDSAREAFTRAIFLDRRSIESYAGLAATCVQTADYDGAREVYGAVLKMEPRGKLASWAYAGLGRLWTYQGDQQRARRMYEKAISCYSGDSWVWIYLAYTYKLTGQLEPARKLFARALEVDHGSFVACEEIANCYKLEGRYRQAQEAYERALKIRKDYRIYQSMAEFYYEQGRDRDAINCLLQALALHPDNQGSYIFLAQIYRRRGNNALALDCDKKAVALQTKVDKLVLKDYYLNIYKIVKKHGAKLVCAQYPMRSIADLKNIFAYLNDILFIDDEDIFKQKVAREGYGRYFSDRFAVDFGHCTSEGNRVLAENVAAGIESYLKIPR